MTKGGGGNEIQLGGADCGWNGRSGQRMLWRRRRRWGNLSQRKLYATCVGVIFPVCLVSAVIYVWRGGVSLLEALPYLVGGLVGGFFGGKLYGKVSTKFLKWLFAAFLFYAGVKYLL